MPPAGLAVAGRAGGALQMGGASNWNSRARSASSAASSRSPISSRSLLNRETSLWSFNTAFRRASTGCSVRLIASSVSVMSARRSSGSWRAAAVSSASVQVLASASSASRSCCSERLRSASRVCQLPSLRPMTPHPFLSSLATAGDALPSRSSRLVASNARVPSRNRGSACSISWTRPRGARVAVRASYQCRSLRQPTGNLAGRNHCRLVGRANGGRRGSGGRRRRSLPGRRRGLQRQHRPDHRGSEGRSRSVHRSVPSERPVAVASLRGRPALSNPLQPASASALRLADSATIGSSRAWPVVLAQH